MRAIAGNLSLSPSDLNDYVECAHLTTLALEVARGGRAQPHVADEQAELLRRKGEEHERAHLERLRAEGRAIVETRSEIARRVHEIPATHSGAVGRRARVHALVHGRRELLSRSGATASYPNFRLPTPGDAASVVTRSIREPRRP